MRARECPWLSSAWTDTYWRAGALIAVSKPFFLAVATAGIAYGLLPANTRHLATFVAPFQLA